MILFIGVCCGTYTDPHCNGKQVIVHLFEWKWTDVALECERYLAKKGFCGVQVSAIKMYTNCNRSIVSSMDYTLGC